MLFLSDVEKQEWEQYAREITNRPCAPGQYEVKIRANLFAAFCYFIGTTLAARGRNHDSLEWLNAGALAEEEGLFSATFLLGFLERHDGKMVAPAVAFSDPRPFIHFTNVPVMKKARMQFIHQCAHTLPAFDAPVRFMDIGCGDGALTVMLLRHLLDTGKISRIAGIHLIDPSRAMIDLAEKTVAAAFPGVPVSGENASIQDCTSTIDLHYDIAMSSLAYHHMPAEDKTANLARLKPWIDHFLLFEMDANNDTPELYSPELAFSVYQSYGRIMDFVFAHDAPVDVVTDCIDSFLMTEVVSLLTKPRGVRSDYHMLRNQWNELLKTGLGPEFTLRCDSACYADEYMTLFTLHYGKGK